MANAYGFAQQIKKDRVPDGYMTTEAGVLPVEWRAEKMSRLIRKLTQAAGEDIYETVSRQRLCEPGSKIRKRIIW